MIIHFFRLYNQLNIFSILGLRIPLDNSGRIFRALLDPCSCCMSQTNLLLATYGYSYQLYIYTDRLNMGSFCICLESYSYSFLVVFFVWTFQFSLSCKTRKAYFNFHPFFQKHSKISTIIHFIIFFQCSHLLTV